MDHAVTEPTGDTQWLTATIVALRTELAFAEGTPRETKLQQEIDRYQAQFNRLIES